MPKTRTSMLNLQFITHYTEAYSYTDSARMALEGGCRWIQLRMKNTAADEREATARTIRDMCRKCGATFIIDDEVELALRLKADGVHLGQKDMPIAQARRVLGPSFIIGGTANTIEEVRAHHQDGADYIGCGPFRFTNTKQGLAPVLGINGYRDIIEAMRKEGITLPLIAIGGITRADIPALMEVGVSGIALSGSVLRAPDPTDEIRRLLALDLPNRTAEPDNTLYV